MVRIPFAAVFTKNTFGIYPRSVIIYRVFNRIRIKRFAIRLTDVSAGNKLSYYIIL